ncbi:MULTISPECIES: hypothetical protein [unclassified Streptomyces]|uniref:hypothetical protein n=1 Tax=unclassified Streptomyces TaxID=2593676 RepID=UPI003D74B62F
MLTGDLVLSIADIDLVRVSLRALVMSVREDAPDLLPPTCCPRWTTMTRPPDDEPPDRLRELSDAASRAFSLLPARPDDDLARGRASARRLGTDPGTVERDLVKLVLTLLALHQAMTNLCAATTSPSKT